MSAHSSTAGCFKLIQATTHARLLLAMVAAFALAGCGGGNDNVAKSLCFDNSIYAEGTSYKLNFAEGETTPVVSGTVISTNASFNGHQGLVEFREQTQDTVITTVTRYLKQLTPPNASEQPSTPGVVALYGTQAAQGATSFTTTTYTPPYEDRRVELLVGETRTFTGQGIREDWFHPAAPYTLEKRVKFVGVERITLPAGTFTACKYEVDGVITEWWHRSLVIRSDFSNGVSRILQSGMLNGTPLKDL